MDVLWGSAVVIGGAIGAGFISGAELVRFFRTEHFVPAVLLSSAVFFLLCALFLWLGKRHGGYHGGMRALFRRAAPIIEGAIALCALIPCAAMLAGLDSLLPRLKPLASLMGLALSVTVLSRGTKGVSLLNSVLVPLLLLFIFIYGSGRAAFSYPVSGVRTGFAGGVLYAGLNVFLMVPLLMDTGAKMKRVIPAAALSSALIAAGALCILGRIYREGAGALNAEMPFLYVLRGKKVFSAAVALAIVTSLVSSLYPPMQLAKRLGGRIPKKWGKAAAEGVVLSAAFGFSRIGLSGIVAVFYPVEGFLGLAFSAFCVLHEYFFEKDHKKVHRGGKQT